LKKLRNKQKRADLKAKQIADQETKEKTPRHEDKENPSSEPAVEKLDPKKLERPDCSLTEAIKFLTPLQMLASDRIETHLLAFEIYYRKGKIMLMLQSLKRATRIDAHHSALHRQLVLFYSLTESQKEQFAVPLKQVIDLELKKLVGNPKITSGNALNEHYLKQNSGSFVHRFESAKLMAMLNKDDNEAKRNAVNFLSSKELEGLEDISLEGCTQMITSLRSGLFGEVDETVVEELKKLCRRVYPLASMFVSASDKKLQNHLNSQQNILSSQDRNVVTNHINSLPGDTILKNDNYVI
jgi:peptide alpha-N-acetyltransferase